MQALGLVYYTQNHICKGQHHVLKQFSSHILFIAKFHSMSFFYLYTSPLAGYLNYFHFSIILIMLWTLMFILLWTCFHFPWGISLGVAILDDIIISLHLSVLPLKKLPGCLPKWLHHLYISQSMCEDRHFLYPWKYLLWSCKNSAVDRVLALYMAGLSSIPGTQDCPLSTTKSASWTQSQEWILWISWCVPYFPPTQKK